MPRTDLLSLTPDDLATLANRGLVKRAQAEIDGDALTYTLSENAAGTVSVLWSDDVHCLLPSGVPLQNGKCSCPASGLCRHLLRSVLAYQREHADVPVSSPEIVDQNAAQVEASSPAPAPVVWNPAEISDADLTKFVAPAVLTRARKTWEAGQVIEVTVGARPSAWFHTLGVNTRFLVAHDARYTHCDCAEAAPCVHVPLAVWAFRELAPGALNALVSTRQQALPVPTALLNSLEVALAELAGQGVVGCEPPFLNRLNRLESDCRAANLVWPAEILAELQLQIEWHHVHNARFEAQKVAKLLGELLVRCDAIRAQTGAVPDVFVRGAATDKTTEVGAARLIGIGTQARSYKGGVELSAFLQDTDSGAVVFINRDFPDPKEGDAATLLRAGSPPPSPQPFWKVAASPVIKGVGLGAIGGGQVLARGGKRAPDGQFSLGRTPISFNFQTFEWEKLRAPLLWEDFTTLEAHLAQMAPASLRPRRASENVYVVPINGVEEARFFGADQEVRAVLRDAAGGAVTLIHPYTARGADGVDALLAALSSPATVRFVAGRFQRTAQGLTVSPLAIVVENGVTRSLIQPWVSPRSATANSEATSQTQSPQSSPSDLLQGFGKQLSEALGELLLLGLHRADDRATRSWEQLRILGEGLGFSRMIVPIQVLSEELARKSKVSQWDATPATQALGQALVLALIAVDTN